MLNLTVAGVTFGLCCLVAEGVLRLMGYGNVEIYTPDPQLFWRLKPNQDCYTKINRQPVRINSLGVRGPEFPPDKPDGTVRILMLGDSRTFGWGLAEADTYPARVEALLNDTLGGSPRVEVINAGVNAWSYAQMAVFLRERGLAWEPDVVVLGPANYWTQFSEDSDPRFVRAMLNRVRLKNLLRRLALYHFVVEVQLKDFYERHRTRFIPVDPDRDPMFVEQQKSDPDARFREAIGAVCTLAREHGAVPVLLYLPTRNELDAADPGRDAINKQAIADEQDVLLVDPNLELRPEADAEFLEADPVHFNAAGSGIIATQLAGALLPLILQ